MVSICRGRRSPDGSAAPAGGSRRCTNACARTCSPRTICLPTTHRCRCSILAAGEPRPDVFGFMPASSAPGEALSRRRRFICSRQIAELSDQLRILRTSKAFFTSTGMPASSSSPKRKALFLPHVGATRGANFTKLSKQPDRLLQLRPCVGSPNSMPSRPRSAANRPRTDLRRVTIARSPLSMPCGSGLRRSSRFCPDGALWPKRSATRSRAGTVLRASCTMAASS